MMQSTMRNQGDITTPQTATRDLGYVHHTTARIALVMAAALGLAADRLFWGGPFGPGWLLWVALFGTAAVILVRQAHYAWQTETILAAAAVVSLAAIPVLRAAPPLTLLTLFAMAVVASMPLLRARDLRLTAMPVIAQLVGVATVAGHAAGGFAALVVSDAGRPEPGSRAWSVPMLAARGALFAAPPIIVFGALFISADPLFHRYASMILRSIREDVLQHVAFGLLFCWITGGLLRGLLPRKSVLTALPAIPTLPATEMTITLASVTTLFLAFVLVQARWLFGGAAALQASTGITVAEYARQGFFQLVAAAALVLPLLLVADAGAQTPATRRLTRILSGALVALVFVVLASALQRMLLYTHRFGLTEQRVYTTAFMGWLAVVFAWYAITALRGERRRFAIGPVVAGVVGVFAVAAINPDALIARVNLERAHARAVVDGAYLTQLSVDATPVLMQHFDELPAAAQCRIARDLLKRHAVVNTDWRTANRSYVRAAHYVQRYRSRLMPAAGDPKTTCPAM